MTMGERGSNSKNRPTHHEFMSLKQFPRITFLENSDSLSLEDNLLLSELYLFNPFSKTKNETARRIKTIRRKVNSTRNRIKKDQQD